VTTKFGQAPESSYQMPHGAIFCQWAAEKSLFFQDSSNATERWQSFLETLEVHP
jgi:hypothetical protein